MEEGRGQLIETSFFTEKMGQSEHCSLNQHLNEWMTCDFTFFSKRT